MPSAANPRCATRLSVVSPSCSPRANAAPATAQCGRWPASSKSSALAITRSQAGYTKASGLAPHHPATCIASARQLVREGKDDEALARFRRALQVGANKLRAADGLVRLGRFDLARQLIKGDYPAQAWLATHLEKGGTSAGIVEELRSDALQSLIALCDSGRAPPWCYERLARHYDQAKDHEEAVRNWRVFVNRRPGSSRRFEYARALVRLGRHDDARRELRRLLASHPAHRAGKQLLVELGAK